MESRIDPMVGVEWRHTQWLASADTIVVVRLQIMLNGSIVSLSDGSTVHIVSCCGGQISPGPLEE
jgi:hypothetical protein